jgi:hypothetical protein
MEVALEKELGAGRHGGWSEDSLCQIVLPRSMGLGAGAEGSAVDLASRWLVSAGVKWEGGGCGLLCGKTTPLVRDLAPHAL